MPRQKENRHLIDHFRGLKPRAGDGIGGDHDLGRQIIRGRACGDLSRPRLRQPGDQAANFQRRAFCRSPVKPRHPCGQWHKSCQIKQWLCALIAAKFGKHLCRSFMFDRNGKQRAKNHIRCCMAHFFFHLDHALRHPRHGGQPGRNHGGKGIPQPSTLKRGINDAALTLPHLAVCHKNRIAQQRVQAFADAV